MKMVAFTEFPIFNLEKRVLQLNEGANQYLTPRVATKDVPFILIPRKKFQFVFEGLAR